MMKKIAIITITNSGYNFGNRLQNYALQRQLQEYGWNVETIRSANTVSNSIILSKLRYNIKSIVKSKDARYNSFRRFNKKHIKFARKIRFGTLNDTQFSRQYDAFLSGSDQIWNPNFHFNSDFEFLSFAEPRKRYSYAASIGVSSIPQNLKSHFATNLKGMHTISVRELSSVKLVEDLTGRSDIYCHIDPTMLLKGDDYLEIEEKPTFKLPESYILVYLLGEKTEEMKKFIHQVSTTLHMEVLELSEAKESKYYGMGPEHFLYCIRHANYICTDSFHGTVFSILFHRKFTVFIRNDADVPMNARIDTLLQMTELNQRLLGMKNIEDSLKTIDYKKVEELLEKKRMCAKDYLKNIEKEVYFKNE